MKRRNLFYVISIVLGIILCVGCSQNEDKNKEKEEYSDVVIQKDDEKNEDNISEVEPVSFHTKSIDALENKGTSNIREYYITNRVTALNHFYIDEDKTLWGEGQNTYGQLGNGEITDDFTIITEPVRIADHVVSVDCSGNGYFCIYLTQEGDLYGMGANICGLLGEGELKSVFSVEEYDKISTPVLLMQNVRFAKAGRESIVVLKEDGSVWWWGQYQSVYLSKPGKYEEYWNPKEDEKNPAKMLYNAPKKILDDCVYVTTGDWTGAAIKNNGDLYTWGLNVFGECGIPVGEDDYVRKPQKVLEDVKMVWVEEIKFNDREKSIVEMADTSTNYIMNVFAQLDNGKMFAVGKDLNNQQRKIGLVGDIAEEKTFSYSDTFVPVEIRDSICLVEDTIKEITVGMSMTEVSNLLQSKNIQFSLGYYPNSYGDEGQDINMYSIVTEEKNYGLLFDDDGKFMEILE